MTDSIRTTPPATVNRRRLIRAAALIPAVPLAAALPSTSPPPTAPPSIGLHLSDPLPAAWDGWRDQIVGHTIEDLLLLMQTELSTKSGVWSRLEAGVTLAQNAVLRLIPLACRRSLCDLFLYPIHDAQTHQMTKLIDQALLFGYGVGMTREHAAHGVEAWHQAALRYAGMAELPPAEDRAASDELNAATDENWRLLGYERITEAERGDPGTSPVNLTRLVGYVPRTANPKEEKTP